MINIFGDQGNGAKNFSGSKEHELKTNLGTRGFINGEQGIKSKNIKGSWEHVPPWEGLLSALKTFVNSEASLCPHFLFIDNSYKSFDFWFSWF